MVTKTTLSTLQNPNTVITVLHRTKYRVIAFLHVNSPCNPTKVVSIFTVLHVLYKKILTCRLLKSTESTAGIGQGHQQVLEKSPGSRSKEGLFVRDPRLTSLVPTPQPPTLSLDPTWVRQLEIEARILRKQSFMTTK